VGNLEPCSEWKQLFGLGFDDDRLLLENGRWNEQVCEWAKEAGAKRFVFLSVNYEVAKALEGPIAGYINGKRLAESKASELFGADNTIVLGLSLVYGGHRFPNLVGQGYRSLVESPLTKAYVASNEFLRNLSVAPLEDWLEKMILCCPPVNVETVARVAAAGAMGTISKDLVGPRRQGFFDTNGKPVVYDDVVFVDGTVEIERLDSLNLVALPVTKTTGDASTTPKEKAGNDEPLWEGALIGKRPFLYPLPVVATFATIFWSVATQQFVQII
jgi:hypothetical protein